MSDIENDDTEVAELRSQDRRERAHCARLEANPDCRDPDHPGCAHCESEENED